MIRDQQPLKSLANKQKINKIIQNLREGLHSIQLPSTQLDLTVNGIWGGVVPPPPVARFFREKYRHSICI